MTRGFLSPAKSGFDEVTVLFVASHLAVGSSASRSWMPLSVGPFILPFSTVYDVFSPVTLLLQLQIHRLYPEAPPEPGNPQVEVFDGSSGMSQAKKLPGWIIALTFGSCGLSTRLRPTSPV